MTLSPENIIPAEIVDAALKVHKALGPGLLESVYEIVLAHELKKRDLTCQRQVSIAIDYDGIQTKFTSRWTLWVFWFSAILETSFFSEDLMQIQLGSLLAGKPTRIMLQSGDHLGLVEGNTGYAVQLGDRLVGFSGEDVAAVNLEVEDGRLNIQLRSSNGQNIGEYRIPGPNALRSDVQALSQMGVHFNASETEELANLMKLTMSGTVSRSEILLLLDELSHVSANISPSQQVSALELYPDIAQQVRKLLQAMPEEIQRFVLLTNKEQFSDDAWKALQLINKIDPARDGMATRFLAGFRPLDSDVVREIVDIATRDGLTIRQPINQFSAKAFAQLVKHIGSLDVAGNPNIFDFDGPVRKFLFETQPLRIPDFTAAASFEELEQSFLIQNSTLKQKGNPLGNALLSRLDTKSYDALAQFLTGTPNSHFSTEVRESAIHFLKNMPQQSPEHKLSSLDAKALYRLHSFLKTSSYAPMLQGLEKHSPSPLLPLGITQIANNFSNLPSAEKLAFFLLDHMDPNRNTELYDYFFDKNSLSKMTSAHEKALVGLIDQDRFPKVQHRDHFSQDKLAELTDYLKKHHKVKVPPGYLPDHQGLREQLLQDTEHQEGFLFEKRGLVKWSDKPADIARSLESQLGKLPDNQFNEQLTESLKEKLGRFFRVAVLDQTWKAQRLSTQILQGKGDVNQAGRELAGNLSDLSRLLGRQSDIELDWDLWTQPSKPLDQGRDPHPALKDKLIHEEKGLTRYFQLDQILPEREAGLKEQVASMTWMRKIERFLEKIEAQRGQNLPNLLEVLEKGQHLLQELNEYAASGDDHSWQFEARSPLSKKKQRQFKEFRDALLQEKQLNMDTLFESPFLRSEFGDSAEQQHSQEMKRLEPMFKELINRLTKEPEERMRQLMSFLDSSNTQDMPGKLRGLLENLRDFNQHQSMNQQPLYLSLPLQRNGQTSEMELACFKLPGSKKRRSRFLAIVHLDFPDWGHLRIDALKDFGSLSATFWAETPKMHHKILNDLHLFEDRLEDAGMGDVMLNVKIAPARATSSVADLCMPKHDGQLDYSI